MHLTCFQCTYVLYSHVYSTTRLVLMHVCLVIFYSCYVTTAAIRFGIEKLIFLPSLHPNIFSCTKFSHHILQNDDFCLSIFTLLFTQTFSEAKYPVSWSAEAVLLIRSHFYRIRIRILLKYIYLEFHKKMYLQLFLA